MFIKHLLYFWFIANLEKKSKGFDIFKTIFNV